MGSYQHDPLLNYNANLLKQGGTELYTLGRNTTQKGIGDLQPVYDYFHKLMSGDTTELMKAIQPETDVVGQQFDQVRSMISDQPRSGGKASTLAELPVEQIKTISSLLAQARNAGAQGAGQVAGQEIGAGTNVTGEGLSAAGQSANIASGGRAQDIGSSFMQNFKSAAGQDLAGALTGLLI